MNFMNRSTFAVSLGLTMLLSGCSIVAPYSEKISINGEPEGAKIIVNGQPFVSPVTVRVPCNKNVSINIVKDGYYPYNINCGYSLGTCGKLDLIGGIIILAPFIGLFAPGAYTLDQHNFYYSLVPVNNK